MEPIQPTLDWYREKSLGYGISPRCPFANTKTCPRFYYTYSLLGSYGISSTINKDQDDELKKMWKQSPLFPIIDEQDTSISSCDKRMSHISNACPEVSYEVFGLFASFLSRYSDEIDSSFAHKMLRKKGAAHTDWRWSWQAVHAAHYYDCPLYSAIKEQKGSEKNSKPNNKEIFQLRPGMFGISIDLKELIKRILRKKNP